MSFKKFIGKFRKSVNDSENELIEFENIFFNKRGKSTTNLKRFSHKESFASNLDFKLNEL